MLPGHTNKDVANLRLVSAEMTATDLSSSGNDIVLHQEKPGAIPPKRLLTDMLLTWTRQSEIGNPTSGFQSETARKAVQVTFARNCLENQRRID